MDQEDAAVSTRANHPRGWDAKPRSSLSQPGLPKDVQPREGGRRQSRPTAPHAPSPSCVPGRACLRDRPDGNGPRRRRHHRLHRLREGRLDRGQRLRRGHCGRAVPDGRQARRVARRRPGRLWIKQGANGVTISALDIDGTNAGALPSPTVNGNDAQFLGVDVTNHHTEICFVIGSSWGRAQRTVIKGSRIHDCGKLPSQNQDHGIYVSEADDTQIIDNVIYANADRGIQLYPDAQRTVVRGNIIDGNGEGIIFSGAGSTAASGSIVEGNVLSNATIRTNVESWYPAGTPAGSDNVVRGNCLWQGAGGTQNTSSGGFTMTSNKVVDPQYVNRAAGDFRLKSGSACANYLSASRAPAGLTGQPPLGVDASTPPAATTPDATTPPATPTPDATTPPATTTPDATTPPATPTPGATTPPPTTTPPATTPAKVTYRCTWIKTSTGRRVKRCVAVTVKATAALKKASTRAASSRKHTKKRSATKRSAKASHKA
jgi:parallel beta-helix repeat protein